MYKYESRLVRASYQLRAIETAAPLATKSDGELTGKNKKLPTYNVRQQLLIINTCLMLSLVVFDTSGE